MKKISILLLANLFFATSIFAQGTTTSNIMGKILDESGTPIIGASVLAVHTPTNTTYGAKSDVLGNYRISNAKVGGPYTIKFTSIGFGELQLENIFLRLGENYRRTVRLEKKTQTLKSVKIVGRSGTVGTSSGSSTQIGKDDIEVMPTLNRDLNDYLRLTPQASSTGEGISFNGINNRFNAIYIDGAVNNDVFGLAGSGTNGGQTGIAPFSIDIIDQLQVVLSPYDVTLGGFAGGGINAVTKSGRNQFFGTAYYFTQNEKLAGKTNGRLADRLGLSTRERLDEFTKKTYGASLGGALKKDKVFFFTNIEIQNDVTPTDFNVQTYTAADAGRATEADLNNLADHLRTKYGYDPGTFGSVNDELKGLKFFGKLDFNLSNNHKLSVRHNFTKAENYDRNSGSSTFLNFSNNGVYFPSVTNTSAIELNSKFGDNMSNNLIIGYTNVFDDRGSIGNDFPYVFIEDGSGTIALGTEQFSTANQLKQNIFTLTDNFKLYKGKHAFTFGTHNEFYNIYNLFIRQNYGSYRFATISDFINGAPATEYDRSYSLVDNITGDGSAAAADFNAMQLGIYAQDAINVTDKLEITAGLRLDVPIITSDPTVDNYMNDTALPKMQLQYPIAQDVQSGKAPNGQLMLSPRVGFIYDMKNDRSTVLRGGVGIFTSRIPFVWPGGMYTNNGLTIGSVSERNISTDIFFNPDINQQLENPAFSVPSGQVDLFTKDFKYPQVLRTNLAFDKHWKNGWDFSIEGLYSKTLNNVVYTNINSDQTVDFQWTGSPDTRSVFNREDIDDKYNDVYVGSNTSKGYTYNFTASASKKFPFGLSTMLAYSYGDAWALNEGTSSQNSSQWRGQVSFNGRNFPTYGRSDYAAGSRIVSALTYSFNWNAKKNAATTVSLFFNGQSGQAFSYVLGGGSARNINNETGSTSRNRSQFWIPNDISEINLVDYQDGTNTITAQEQWDNLDALIKSDKSLQNNRGDYAPKNGARAPFQGTFDLGIRQDLGKIFNANAHKLQLSLDIFNFANMLNNEWGTVYTIPGDFNNYFLTQFEGYEADGTTPKFTYRGGDKLEKERFDIAGTASRWRMRLGIRYSFN